jgi:hypothetical protein
MGMKGVKWVEGGGEGGLQQEGTASDVYEPFNPEIT